MRPFCRHEGPGADSRDTDEGAATSPPSAPGVAATTYERCGGHHAGGSKSGRTELERGSYEPGCHRLQKRPVTAKQIDDLARHGEPSATLRRRAGSSQEIGTMCWLGSRTDEVAYVRFVVYRSLMMSGACPTVESSEPQRTTIDAAAMIVGQSPAARLAGHTVG